MRAVVRLIIPLAALLGLVMGCGGRFQLPTERRTARIVPTDSSYAVLATWKSSAQVDFSDLRDVMITRGAGEQLFMLFCKGGSGGPGTRQASVKLFPFTQPVPIGPPFFEDLASLFNPVALASAQNRLFVLDAGDSCMAKTDPMRGVCYADEGDTTHNGRGAHPDIVYDYDSIWRVREYGISGGDTISTFTDTTMAVVRGIGADDYGYVYVSGFAAVLDTDTVDHRIRTRKFVPRIYRYARGPRYAGVVPNDINMPGANWHRDTTWVVINGTGKSTVADPRRITWTPTQGGAVFVADSLNNRGKLIGTSALDLGLVWMNGSETLSQVLFNGPNAVAVDGAGYLYIIDRLNLRVLRYDGYGTYVQDVNIENNSDGFPLLNPVAIGVDDSLAYVGDPGRGQVIRYKRRQ